MMMMMVAVIVIIVVIGTVDGMHDCGIGMGTRPSC